MLIRLPGAALLCFLLTLSCEAQTHSGYPVDIIAGPAPRPVRVDDRTRLVYELHLTNFAPWPIEVTNIDVLSGSQDPLASYDREALAKCLIGVEKVLRSVEPTEGEGARIVGEGHSVVIFLDVTLNRGAAVPAELRHRFSFSVIGDDGKRIERTLNGPAIAIAEQTTSVLQPPVRGMGWVAMNAYSSYSHRRAFNPVDGRIRIAERFAIDWTRLAPDGRFFHGDTKSNANYYAYGAEVLAVGEGVISDLRDGRPDNVGGTERSSRVINIDNALGNYVTIDLGKGRFAVYAHLQPGSLKVRLGSRVKAGQVLALLGNSGNSDAPHLHFQLVDANSPLGSEGIPYEFENYTQVGVMDDAAAILESGGEWRPRANEKPALHRKDFPFDKAVVSFP